MGESLRTPARRAPEPTAVWPSTRRDTFYRRRGKRLLDLTLCLLVLPFALIPMCLVAAAVRLTLGSPVLFRQRRPGLTGKPFTMLKFRTMREGTDADGRASPDERRLTRFGRLLRRTSLDELPGLWNVLCGHMSMVGPRPLRMEYLELYTPAQARRHEVRPGMTGWAQVRGRNAIAWEEKFALDIWYVDHLSLIFDLKILGLTVIQVVAGGGVSAAGHATMPDFKGSLRVNDP